MTKSTWPRRVVPVIVGAAVIVATGMLLDRKKTLADLTVGQIEDAITSLDPVTRAAVVARLGADAAGQIKNRLHD